MKQKSVLLWIPLRPGSNWVGEGIAGTIERVLNRWDNTGLCVVALEQHIALMKKKKIKEIKEIKFYSVPQVPEMFQRYEGILPSLLYRCLRLSDFLLNSALYIFFSSYLTKE